MRLLIGLGHPAHYHLFKSLIKHCYYKAYDCRVVILNKDVLEDLLIEEEVPYIKIIDKERTSNVVQKLKELRYANNQFAQIVKEFKPSLIIGCINQVAHIGWKHKIDSLFFAEDDFTATFLQGLLIYPFIRRIITPVCTSVGPFKYKQLTYESYHELAYLHPDNFNPDKSKIEHLLKNDQPYYILRFSDLNAYHDINKKGISKNFALKMIKILKLYGNIYISSEKQLDKEFEQYRIKIPSVDIHHALYYADMFIGDSQTMTAEAAILGTTALRYNSFVGKLGYLEELEHKYRLTCYSQCSY